MFPDGTHLSEPSNEELAEKVGLERAAKMHVYDLVVIGGGPAASPRRSTLPARPSGPSSAAAIGVPQYLDALEAKPIHSM